VDEATAVAAVDYVRDPTGAVVGVSTVSRSSLGSSGSDWLWYMPAVRGPITNCSTGCH
jgi:hypothetical protein